MQKEVIESYSMRKSYEQCIQHCSKYKVQDYSFHSEKNVTDHLKNIRHPKRTRMYKKHVGSKHACKLNISQIPKSLLTKYCPEKNMFRGIHKTSSGNWQAQIWNPSQNRLVHQGIFEDKDVAALAVHIAKQDKRCFDVEHLARKIIESSYESHMQSLKSNVLNVSDLL